MTTKPDCLLPDFTKTLEDFNAKTISTYGRPALPSPTPPTYPMPRTSSEPGPLVWHEAAHAIVGHRLGMKIHFIDLSGLMIASPICGLDVDPVPPNDRPRATGITALAGPIGEQSLTKGYPIWRQDGDVARASAKALANTMPEQMALLIEWSRIAEEMLGSDPAYRPLVYLLDRKRALTGAEFEYVINTTRSA